MPGAVDGPREPRLDDGAHLVMRVSAVPCGGVDAAHGAVAAAEGAPPPSSSRHSATVSAPNSCPSAAAGGALGAQGLCSAAGSAGVADQAAQLGRVDPRHRDELAHRLLAAPHCRHQVGGAPALRAEEGKGAAVHLAVAAQLRERLDRAPSGHGEARGEGRRERRGLAAPSTAPASAMLACHPRGVHSTSSAPSPTMARSCSTTGRAKGARHSRSRLLSARPAPARLPWARSPGNSSSVASLTSSGGAWCTSTSIVMCRTWVHARAAIRRWPRMPAATAQTAGPPLPVHHSGAPARQNFPHCTAERVPQCLAECCDDEARASRAAYSRARRASRQAHASTAADPGADKGAQGPAAALFDRRRARTESRLSVSPAWPVNRATVDGRSRTSASARSLASRGLKPFSPERTRESSGWLQPTAAASSRSDVSLTSAMRA